MQINADQLIQQITDQKYPTLNKSIRRSTLKNGRAFQPLIKFVNQQLENHQAAQTNLKVLGTDWVFSLEVNVINLPYSSIRPMKRLVTNNGQMPANVYVMFSAHDLNRSHFRIDEVTTADDFIQRPTNDLTQINRWIKDQLAKLKANQAAEKAKPKATRKAKKARSKRKTSRQRRTHRKKKCLFNQVNVVVD